MQLTRDQAINIALGRAGVSRSSISDLDTELDSDDGVLIWEIDFEVGDYEFEFEIHAYTGAIIEWDREYDD